MSNSFGPIKINDIRALHDWVLVTEMNFRERTTSSGIILHSDNGTTAGIRPRWAQVYAVGPEQKHVRIGQWICVAHGRWTRGIDIEDQDGDKTIRRVDPEDILLVSDEPPGADDTMSDAVQAQARDRF
jgi:co-chaperonin GroES (HSP10)